MSLRLAATYIRLPTDITPIRARFFSLFLPLLRFLFSLSANWRSPFSAHSPYTMTPSKKSALWRPASSLRKNDGDRRRCKEGTDTSGKSNHNFAAQSHRCGKGDARERKRQDRGWRRSFCYGRSWPQRWTQQYRVPGLAFYGAIRARWCVIMAPYRGKAISVRRPTLRQPRPRSSSCYDGYDIPRTRRFSPLNVVSCTTLVTSRVYSAPSLFSKLPVSWIMPFADVYIFNRAFKCCRV